MLRQRIDITIPDHRIKKRRQHGLHFPDGVPLLQLMTCSYCEAQDEESEKAMLTIFERSLLLVMRLAGSPASDPTPDVHAADTATFCGNITYLIGAAWCEVSSC
jgi:hypothetical protein